MFKKLSEDARNNILETGISLFAQNGFDKTNMNEVAKSAGVSVGVIYKYYLDKDKFFLECVRHSLGLLNDVLDEAASNDTDVEECVQKVIMELIKNAKIHSDYNVMYNEITSGGAKKYAAQLAKEIEEISYTVYAKMIKKAKNDHRVKGDLDPRLFAFFFDNLLMILQFSYSCDYYKERMKIYCGEDIFTKDELVADELMKFVKGAFGM